MKTPTPDQLRLAAEIIETGCEWEIKDALRVGVWHRNPNSVCPVQTIANGYEIRKKPQPQPDKWAAEKAAFKAGKVIQWRQINPTFSSWVDTDGPGWFTDVTVEYRVKPWQLTNHLPGFRPLAPGEQWHRNDFTEDMLPEGWRPLLYNEIPQGGDEAFDGDSWRSDWIAIGDYLNDPLGKRKYARHRTRRPLPPLKSEKRISLEPGDVPPGSAIRRVGSSSWSLVSCLSEKRIGFITGTFGESEIKTKSYLPEEIVASHEILRPGSTTWEPCSKPQIP